MAKSCELIHQWCLEQGYRATYQQVSPDIYTDHGVSTSRYISYVYIYGRPDADVIELIILDDERVCFRRVGAARGVYYSFIEFLSDPDFFDKLRDNLTRLDILPIGPALYGPSELT